MSDAKKKENKKKSGGSKISNTEWGMAIGVLLLIDLVEAGLDLLFGIGAFTNPFIDLAVNLLWPTYLYLRGVNLKSVRMFGTLIIGGALQEIPGFDGFWTIEGVIIMLIVKAEEKIKEETGVDAGKIGAAGAGGAAGASGGAATAEAGTAGVAGEDGGISDADADALGQESDASGQERESDNPDMESARAEGEEGDGEHETSDEDADELGEESDNKSEENETPEEKKKREEEEKKKKDGKKKPRGGGGGLGGGGGQGGRGEGGAGQDSNPLDLRGSSADRERAAEKRRLGAMDNLLDLGNSYRGGEGEEGSSV